MKHPNLKKMKQSKLKIMKHHWNITKKPKLKSVMKHPKLKKYETA